MKRIFQMLPVLLASVVTAQSSIAFLEGASPTDLRLTEIDEKDPAAPGTTLLTGIELLPLEITNRTVQQSLRADRPRRVVRGGFERVELPQNGRLLRYRINGGARYGFLWVDASGSASVVLELPGVGAAATDDPFEDRFGIAVDGRHAVVVTTAGGALVVRLDGKDYQSTGTPARPVAVPGAVCAVSVCVGASHAFLQTMDERLWRCRLADTAVPEDVTPAKVPNAVLKEEMALSGDGNSAVFLLGPKRLFDLWLLGNSGPPQKLSAAPPSKYEEPGYLPEFAGGPLMLLNEDGTRLLYTDSTNREEIYLMDTTGATPITHVTSDPNIAPYIGIGTLPAFAGHVLTIAIGDPDLFDWYSATTESPAIVNLTRTAPEPTAPYGAGTLVPNTAYELATGTLIEEADGSGGTRLRHVDAQGGTTIVASSLLSSVEPGTSVRTLPETRRDASGLSLGPGSVAEEHLRGAKRRAPIPGILITTQQGDTLSTASLEPRVQGPPGVRFSPESHGPAGFSIFLASVPASGLAVPILRSPNGKLVPLAPDPALTQTYVTPRLGIVLNGTTLDYLGGGPPVVLSAELIHIVLL